MDRMRIELAHEGHLVHFAGINDDDSAEYQADLVRSGAFPLFQDLAEVDAWGLHDGHKDDVFIYDAEGHVTAYRPQADDGSTDLSTPAGYAGLKAAIVTAIEP